MNCPRIDLRTTEFNSVVEASRTSLRALILCLIQQLTSPLIARDCIVRGSTEQTSLASRSSREGLFDSHRFEKRDHIHHIKTEYDECVLSSNRQLSTPPAALHLSPSKRSGRSLSHHKGVQAFATPV